MMNDDDLRRALSTIDDPVDDVPADFDAALWAELHDTLAGRRVTQHDGDIIPLRPTDPPRMTQRRRVRRWPAAAAVVLVAASTAVLLARQAPQDAADRPSVVPPSTTIAPITDPALACERFRSADVDVTLIARDLANGTLTAESAAAAIGPAIDALEQLERDLSAAGIDVDAVAVALGGVRQASRELADGDVGRAIDSLEFAGFRLTQRPELTACVRG